MVRARESRREDRLFDDPYAQAFVDACPGAFAEESVHATASPEMASLGARFYRNGVLRTRFFDDYLLAATAAGCRQVVLLAAGLDTRAFRSDWSAEIRLFELDLPEVLSFKDAVLRGHGAVPRVERITVPADLRGDWPAALAAAGFDPRCPTAWLAEGLLIYLTAEQAHRMLTSVGELSAPSSQLAFEHTDDIDSLIGRAGETPAMASYTALWRGGLGANTVDWLARHGWRPRLHEIAAVAADYGRPAAGPATETPGGFLTAIRVGRFTG